MLYNGLHILTRVHTNDTCHYSSMFKNMILLHTKCKHVPHAISMLKKIFLLHIKTLCYHRKYPMCYAKCHIVDIFPT